MVTSTQPALERFEHDGVAFWSDRALWTAGVLVAFSERIGGVSRPPFDSLDLAAHVGDDPGDVDENRRRFLSALGLEKMRGRLVMAEQVHGSVIARIAESDAGRGAFASRGAKPVAATDALLTDAVDVPLGLCFADCVPVVLVAGSEGVCVVHAGWRGALASLPGSSARRLAETSGIPVGEIRAYVGAHIGAADYVVDGELMSQFVNTFGTFARAESGGLDLDAAVTASLETAGVASCNITRLGVSTAGATDRFYSYRAEAGQTGRHMALACLLSGVPSSSASP